MKCKLKRDVLFDYVEGELSADVMKDISLHLTNCKECQSEVQSLEGLRHGFKKSKLAMPDDKFFDGLEAKIMSRVETLEAPVQSGATASVATGAAALAAKFKIAKNARSARAFLMSMVGVVLLSGGFYLRLALERIHGSANENLNTGHSVEDHLLAEAGRQNPEAFNDVILNDQDFDSLVMNAAAVKLSGMSDRELRRMLK